MSNDDVVGIMVAAIFLSAFAATLFYYSALLRLALSLKANDKDAWNKLKREGLIPESPIRVSFRLLVEESSSPGKFVLSDKSSELLAASRTRFKIGAALIVLAALAAFVFLRD